MRVGVPIEVTADEYRVSMTPDAVRELVARGHSVVVQRGAGEGAAIDDNEYMRHGASIVPDAETVFAESELIVKVKAPNSEEAGLLTPEHTLLAYLHLAADRDLTRRLLESGATCIAYETVRDRRGKLPLLAPMSAVAGKVAAQAGAFLLEKPVGGRGVLLGGAPGVPVGKVMIIGGGVVGLAAARVATGMGARTFVFDRSLDRLRELDQLSGKRFSTIFSTTVSIDEMLPEVDLVIGSVLVHGARTPRLISRHQLRRMKHHAVLVDVSIDQGGCIETSRPTTHGDPTYEVDGITHYCVPNMPAAVPVISTVALATATLPYVVKLAELGAKQALLADPALISGLNIAAGRVTAPAVAEAHGLAAVAAQDALQQIAVAA